MQILLIWLLIKICDACTVFHGRFIFFMLLYKSMLFSTVGMQMLKTFKINIYLTNHFEFVIIREVFMRVWISVKTKKDILNIKSI